MAPPVQEQLTRVQTIFKVKYDDSILMGSPGNPSQCVCGQYHFQSASCPHSGAKIPKVCGATTSEATGNPVFCPKPAPKVWVSQYTVTDPCTPCKNLIVSAPKDPS